MANHSTTSQYGTLSRSKNMVSNEQKAMMRERLVHDIKGGLFVKEWSAEQASGSKLLEKLKADVMENSMSRAEEQILPLVQEAHAL